MEVKIEAGTFYDYPLDNSERYITIDSVSPLKGEMGYVDVFADMATKENPPQFVGNTYGFDLVSNINKTLDLKAVFEAEYQGVKLLSIKITNTSSVDIFVNFTLS